MPPTGLAVQNWVIRSLVKRGIWGSGLDTLLTRLRRIIDEHGQSGFPVADLERDMTVLGKSLGFDPTEIDELLEMRYGGQRTFSVLSLLYPGLDLTKEFHEDHIFPRSRFTAKRLADAGIPHDHIEQLPGGRRLPPEPAAPRRRPEHREAGRSCQANGSPPRSLPTSSAPLTCMITTSTVFRSTSPTSSTSTLSARNACGNVC